MPPIFTFKRGQSTPSGPNPGPGAIDAFKAFVEAEDFPEARSQFETLLVLLQLESGPFYQFYPKLKAALKEHVPFKYKEIFKIMDNKAKQKPYGGRDAEGRSVLVVGGGPVGLRTAIETQLLGARTVLVEKRGDFTRNNILKLWKFLLADFKSLGAKKFVGKFCSGQINHIGIQCLQLFLAKVCMILGVDVQCPAALVDLIEPSADKGWRAKFTPEGNAVLDNYVFDMVVVASGKRVPLEGFNRRSLDAKMSIAVTANFVNHGTSDEISVAQIPGVSRQYHQDYFRDMKNDVGIDLENIVYYRGNTHYFVMTALRKSLLDKGVILEDKEDRKMLLHPNNINKDKLHEYAISAAQYSTKHFSTALPTKEFALDARGNPDCAIFDFTNLYSARNASMVKVRKGHQLLITCVGDSLLEPFWPEGTGCGRGILSALDAAWLYKQWVNARINPLEILTERENIYKLLSQTSDQGGELKHDYKAYTINPSTRYKNIPKKIDHEKILTLYDTDAPEEFNFLKDKFINKQFFDTKEYRTMLQKFRKGVINKKNAAVKVLRRQQTQNAAA